MAQSRISLPLDPRYKSFVERYAFDCTRFAIEVCGLVPTWQQIELFDSVSVPGSRTSVSSGHGCFGRGTSIMLADGSTIAVEDVRKGDIVMGPDACSGRAVLELKRGREDMYRVTYADGTGHDFNKSHILCLISPTGYAEKVALWQWLNWDAQQRAGWTAYRASGPGKFERLAIAEVECIGERTYYGFTLAGDGLFLLGDGTVTSNTGKTSGFAIIALWHLLCYFSSNTILTAPKITTVSDGVWKEFADLSNKIQNGPQSWVREYFEIESERVYVKGFKLNWFVIAKTAPRGSPENLAGAHRDWLLWLGDEASGIPDANFGVITGSLTDENNRIAIASQPTRPTGFFYDTHHRLSKEKGGAWNALVFNSEQSPIVSAAFILEKRAQYTEEEYAIKVLGLFPENSSRFLLGPKAIEACKGLEVIKPGEPYGWLLPLDVGGGGYRDWSVMPAFKVAGMGEYGPDARRAQLVSVPLHSNSINPAELHGHVITASRERANSNALIDAGGMGLIVCKQLDLDGFANYSKVNWGLPNFAKEYKERYFNQRAQAICGLTRAVQEGRFGISSDVPASFVAKLVEQGARIPYHYDEKARRVIAKKEDMRKEGIPSPDIWDTCSFPFLEGAHVSLAEDFDVSGVAGGAKEDARARILAKLNQQAAQAA